MARFSDGGEEDDGVRKTHGSSSTGQGSKRQRTTQQTSPPLVIESEPEDQEAEKEEGEEAEEESDQEEEEEEEEEAEEESDRDEEEEEDEDDEEVEGLTDDFSSIDPVVFDCPICLEPFSSPVFQCENGHTICPSCCVEIRNKCPTCGLPTGYNRCLALEKLIEVAKKACSHTRYGCREMLSYKDHFVHEVTCPFGPCSCPLPNCSYTGPALSFYKHFGRRHPNAAENFIFNKFFSVSVEINQKYVVLQESNETIIFVLGHCTEHTGSMMSVVRIAPSATLSPRLSYQLTAKHEDSSITLRSPVECTSMRTDFISWRKFILVPAHFVSSTGQFHLEVCIWKHEGVEPAPVA